MNFFKNIRSTSPAMHVLIVFLLTLVIGIVGTIIFANLLKDTWNWFIVPPTNFNKMNAVQAYGMSLFAGVITIMQSLRIEEVKQYIKDYSSIKVAADLYKNNAINSIEQSLKLTIAFFIAVLISYGFALIINQFV